MSLRSCGLRTASRLLTMRPHPEERALARVSKDAPHAPPHSRDRLCPSFANSFAPKKRGRREDRVRAAPAVSCAICAKETHTSIQVKRRQSGLPCAMVLRLISCSPRRSGFLATVTSVMRSIIASLTPASRRQDHTTSPYASAPFVNCANRVHRIPPRVS